MNRTSQLILVSLVVLATACGRSRPVDFNYGVPTKEMVNVRVPDSASSPLRSSDAEALGPRSMADLNQQLSMMAVQGETSDLYGLTVLATVVVNGSTLWVLGALRDVTARRPTSVSGNTAVYGPHTPFLSPITWKLSVTRTDFNVFTYVLEGKDKDAPDSAYRTVLSGSHTVSVDVAGDPMPGYGQGTFLIEWDQANDLPGRAQDTGSCEFSYARVGPSANTTVDVTFNNTVDNDPSATFNAEYRFLLEPSQAGRFEFALDLNIHPFNPYKPALERWAIKSRWTAQGAGRSDVRVTGGELTAPETVNECWDASFLSTYLARSYDPAANYGNSDTACVFTNPSYSEL
jgi:hypothetical protein